MLNHQEQQKIIGALLKRKENVLCADCNSKMPCWASLDFGVFVCMNCSGAHRALGPSVTRVKSTRLDTWNRDWLQNMQVGNSILNSYWQNQLNDSQNSPRKPTTNSSIQDIIKYVQDKYVRKLFVDPKQKMNPLQKYKSGENLRTENSTKNIDKNIQNKEQKVVQENVKKQVFKQVSKVQQKKFIPDFTVFDKVVKTNKPPSQSEQNLLNFDELKNKNFDDKNKQVKYNKQQFMSLGGVPATNNKKEVNFEGFSKINVNQKPNNKNVDFINFDMLLQRKNQKSNNTSCFEYMNYFPQNQQANEQNKLHYRNAYTTMGWQQQNYMQPNIQRTGHLKRAMTIQSKTNNNTNLGIQKNIFQKQATMISLQSNLNFENFGQKINKAPKLTSWVDDWK